LSVRAKIMLIIRNKEWFHLWLDYLPQKHTFYGVYWQLIDTENHGTEENPPVLGLSSCLSWWFTSSAFSCLSVSSVGHIFPQIALIYTDIQRFSAYPCHPWAVYPPRKHIFLRLCVNHWTSRNDTEPQITNSPSPCGQKSYKSFTSLLFPFSPVLRNELQPLLASPWAILVRLIFSKCGG